MAQRILGVLLLMAGALSAAGQSAGGNEGLLRHRLPDWVNYAFQESALNSRYKISAFINPLYLEADFNGDGKQDIAVAVEEKETQKKGLIVLHAEGEGYFIVGAGNRFGNGGDDFSWMDIWKVHRASIVEEVTYTADDEIDGSNAVQLKNPGILVEKSESAGGVISWDGRQYIWTQAGD